jgi:hypothetical protein
MKSQPLIKAERISPTQARGPCPFGCAVEHVYDLGDGTRPVIWVRAACDAPRARDQFGGRRWLALRIIEEAQA